MIRLSFRSCLSISPPVTVPKIVRAHSPADTSLAASVPGDDLISLFVQQYDKPQTRRAYRTDLEAFFVDRLGTDRIDLALARRITFVEVNGYLDVLESRGYKTSTMRRKLVAVRGFFEWLWALGVIERNPAHKNVVRRLKRSGGNDRLITVLTSAQAGQLIEAAATQDNPEVAIRDQVLITTLLHCVLRRSEAAAMRFEYIRPLGPYWVLDLPNTKSGTDQFVKIPAHVVDAITGMSDDLALGGTGDVWRSLSRNSYGNRLSARSIYTVVNRAAKRAGLTEKVGAHTLRHTGCTLAIEAGASLQQVQSHARHKNLETTMVYVHQRDRLKESAADFIHVTAPRTGTRSK
jgi:site-specific recombinase XerD